MTTKHKPPIPEGFLMNTMIIAVIIGIFLASLGVWIIRNYVHEQDQFSELYFPNPEELPNEINLDKNYSFMYSIKSNEEWKKNLTFYSGIELYNLYEVTEYRYKCLSRFRDKIYLDWTNETNLTFAYPEKEFEIIEEVAMPPDYSQNINWSSYTIEYGFQIEAGRGQMTMFFRNKTDVHYFIMIDETNEKIIFNNKTVHEGFTLREHINYVRTIINDNRINFYLNNKLIFSETYNRTINGQIGFETHDVYAPVNNLKIYRDSPIAIPDTEGIKEYYTNSNFLFDKITTLKKMKSRSVRLFRSFSRYNESIDCSTEYFYCEYFDLENDITFFLPEENLTKVVEKVPVEGNINYRLYPTEKEEALINWTDFSIDFSHSTISSEAKGSIILKFSDKWAIMITRNNSYFIKPINNGTLIDEFRNPKMNRTGTEYVNISVNQQSIQLKINDKLVFSKETPLDYTNGYLESYIKNAFISVDEIHMQNHDEQCSDPYAFKFCELYLESRSVPRRPYSDQQQNFRVDYIDYQREQTQFNLFELTRKINLSQNISGNLTQNETYQNITEPIKHVLDILISNPFIPDRRIIFNTPSTRVVNETNFALDYNYVGLDGSRVMEIGFMDLNENELLSMYVLERKNRAVIYYYDGEETQTYESYFYINKSKGHTLKLESLQGDAIFYIDNQIIREIPNVDIDNGQFFIGSRNTYLEIGNIHLNINDTRRTLGVRQNPCELKPIYRETKAGNITLEPGQDINITSTFNIDRDFDYGKVFVELYGSTGTNVTHPLEVHFWVIRND